MFKPCTKERYYEMLEVLPPAHWDNNGFLVGEPTDHRECSVTAEVRPTYAAFVNFDGRYFESVHSLTIPEYRSYALNRLPC